MQINLENNENHSVEAYSDHQIKINAVTYKNSLLVSKNSIIDDLTIQSIEDVDKALLEKIVALGPEIIILGHSETGKLLPVDLRSELSRLRIGFESMSIGAACRTYNVLLSEARAVVALFIL